MANEDVPLLKLPPEIRLVIYGYLFQPTSAIALAYCDEIRSERNRIHVSGSGLLRTCKLLYEEYRCFLYPRILFAPNSILDSCTTKEIDIKEIDVHNSEYWRRKDLPLLSRFAFRGLERNTSLLRRLYLNTSFDYFSFSDGDYDMERGDEMMTVLQDQASTDLEEIQFYYFVERTTSAPWFLFWETFLALPEIPLDHEIWESFDIDVFDLTRFVGLVEQILTMKPRLKKWVLKMPGTNSVYGPSDFFGLVAEGQEIPKHVRMIPEPNKESLTEVW